MKASKPAVILTISSMFGCATSTYLQEEPVVPSQLENKETILPPPVKENPPKQSEPLKDPLREKKRRFFLPKPIIV